MDQLNNSVIREPAAGDVNMRETVRGAVGGGEWRGEGVARDVTVFLLQSVTTRRSGRSRNRRHLYTRKYDKNRQNFRPAVSLTFQGVEIGGRPVGVMCDVLAG